MRVGEQPALGAVPLDGEPRALGGVLLAPLPGQREVGLGVGGKHLRAGGRVKSRALCVPAGESAMPTKDPTPKHTLHAANKGRTLMTLSMCRLSTCAVLPVVMACSACWCFSVLQGVRGGAGPTGASSWGGALGCPG